MDTTRNKLGIGLVGAGGFGEFCLAAFGEMDEVRIAAIADIDRSRAETLAARYGSAGYADYEALLADPNVDIVALNTPPYLHAPQGLAALGAKKHLFCEKPLALTIEDGEALIGAAKANGVLLTVDYVMRYNPFWASAAALRRAGVLGALRHMDLANHANGLSLPATHWFWDVAKSGGIWIEHGVHFFDAFSWVSGQPGIVAGEQHYARDDGAIDRVECLLRYGDTAAHCYHAFDQSSQTEQTTVVLTFERGYVTLREWVPTSLELVTSVDRGAWSPYLQGAVTALEIGDHRTIAKATAPEGKSAIYKHAIQAGMRALTAAIQDPEVDLVVSGEMALESLRTALTCTELGSNRYGTK